MNVYKDVLKEITRSLEEEPEGWTEGSHTLIKGKVLIFIAGGWWRLRLQQPVDYKPGLIARWRLWRAIKRWRARRAVLALTEGVRSEVIPNRKRSESPGFPVCPKCKGACEVETAAVVGGFPVMEECPKCHGVGRLMEG